jgi:hypothetical protein
VAYRLLVRTLSKAGKAGLVPVQRMVTKKGKTFMQTFYVKPEEAKPEKKQPSVQSVKRPKLIMLLRGDNTYEFESNRPEGGFYIASTNKAGEDEAVRVPGRLIESVFESKGYTFVVHRALTDENSWSDRYVVTELTTGKRACVPRESPEAAIALTHSNIDPLSKEAMDEIVSNKNAPKVAGMDNVITETDDWPEKQPERKLSNRELNELAKEIRSKFLDEDQFSQQEVRDWLYTSTTVATEKDREDLLREFESETQQIIQEAIIEKMTFSDAHARIEALDEVQSALGNLNTTYGTTYNMEQILEWADKHEDGFTTGFNSYMYGVNYESGDEAWTPGDVIAYAIENDVSLDNAQQNAENFVDDEEAQLKAEEAEYAAEDISFTDGYGNAWDFDSLNQISRWVGGTVKSVRDTTKEIDELLRRGSSEPKPMNKILDVVEEKMVTFDGDALYRGTGNLTWGTAEVGDVIPYGLASFSQSSVEAEKFGKYLLVMEPAEDNPIKGLDIYTTIRDGREAGFENELSSMAVDEYYYEQEFIVRAPSLEVVRREGNSVYVRPHEMDLLEVMKSLFGDVERIKNLERTFDYSLHREPEGIWE